MLCRCGTAASSAAASVHGSPQFPGIDVCSALLVLQVRAHQHGFQCIRSHPFMDNGRPLRGGMRRAGGCFSFCCRLRLGLGSSSPLPLLRSEASA